MITERDQIALDFIELFGVATTHQINKVAYGNMRVCQRRLATMLKMGVVLRESNLYSKEYLYSVKKQNLKQLKHKLLRNEFYLKLMDIADIPVCRVEDTLGPVRPDATMIVIPKGEEKRRSLLITVEIESSNNTINVSKYEKMAKEKEESLPMPLVVYVTTKNIPQSSHFRWVKVSPSLDDLDKILL